MIGLREEFPVVAMDFQTAGEASAQIKRLLKKLGVNSGVVRRLSIACYEAEINLVIHSMGGRLTLIVDAHEVTLISDDDGPGIPPEELPHLFDRYYRARQDAGKTGTGLGLSITKAILQQHDFPFGVNSTVGKGSTFWFEMKAPQ